MRIKYDLTSLAEQMGIYPPSYAYPGDAGVDLCALSIERYDADACEYVDANHDKSEFILFPGSMYRISTGYKFYIPHGYAGFIHDRSSLAQRGLKTAGGIIDSGYRAEIKVICTPLTSPLRFRYTDKIAQIIFQPVVVDGFSAQFDYTRGEAGFGSSNRG